MDPLFDLAPYLIGAIIILALINIMRNFMAGENDDLDFHSHESAMELQSTAPYARNYNAFLAELEELPQENASYIDLDKPSPISIPAQTPIVGALQVRFAGHLIVVTIGDHTEQRFAHQYTQAGKFILDILTDQYVFHLYDGRADIYLRDDFIGPGDLDRNFYVWSGRLLDQMMHSR